MSHARILLEDLPGVPKEQARIFRPRDVTKRGRQVQYNHFENHVDWDAENEQADASQAVCERPGAHSSFDEFHSGRHLEFVRLEKLRGAFYSPLLIGPIMGISVIAGS